jgi:hypothetical protein
LAALLAQRQQSVAGANVSLAQQRSDRRNAALAGQQMQLLHRQNMEQLAAQKNEALRQNALSVAEMNRRNQALQHQMQMDREALGFSREEAMAERGFRQQDIDLRREAGQMTMTDRERERAHKLQFQAGEHKFSLDAMTQDQNFKMQMHNAMRTADDAAAMRDFNNAIKMMEKKHDMTAEDRTFARESWTKQFEFQRQQWKDEVKHRANVLGVDLKKVEMVTKGQLDIAQLDSETKKHLGQLSHELGMSQNDTARLLGTMQIEAQREANYLNHDAAIKKIMSDEKIGVMNAELQEAALKGQLDAQSRQEIMQMAQTMEPEDQAPFIARELLRRGAISPQTANEMATQTKTIPNELSGFLGMMGGMGLGATAVAAPAIIASAPISIPLLMLSALGGAVLGGTYAAYSDGTEVQVNRLNPQGAGASGGGTLWDKVAR